MGSMMGCVLSTDKAKLFINCVITAIAMIVPPLGPPNYALIY